MSNIPSRKNKIFNKNNFSNWIIGGVIALIITKVSDPLSEFLFTNFLNIGGSIITYVSNSTYREISNGFSEQSSSVVLYFVFLLLIVLLEGIYLFFFLQFKIRKNELNKSFTSNDDSTAISENSNDVTSDNLHEQGIKSFKKRERANIFYLLKRTFLCLFLLFILTYFYGQSNFIRNKTIALTNNIEIVSPYISDIEYKQLKSKFHSMETQSDYNELMEKLEDIATEYSLKLK